MREQQQWEQQRDEDERAAADQRWMGRMREQRQRWMGAAAAVAWEEQRDEDKRAMGGLGRWEEGWRPLLATKTKI